MAIENTLQVGETILAQLGGSRFVAMTGAKNFVAGADFLQFSIGSGAKRRANKVRVTLDANDQYTIATFRIANRGLDVHTLEVAHDTPAENLRETFTRLTGFDCTL